MHQSEMVQAKARIEAMRETLLRQMEIRFGTVPDNLRRIIAETYSRPRLRSLAEELLDAESIDQMTLSIEYVGELERDARKRIAAEVAKRPPPPVNERGETEVEEFERLLELPENLKVKEMEAVWFEHSQIQGALEGQRELIAWQLLCRFPGYPKSFKAIESRETLNQLAEQVLSASSLEEMGLIWGPTESRTFSID